MSYWEVNNIIPLRITQVIAQLNILHYTSNHAIHEAEVNYLTTLIYKGLDHEI